MEISTERLHLREFTPQDTKVIATYRTDPRYLEHYYREAFTHKECEQFVEKCMRWSKEKPRTKYQLAITSKTDAFLGNCGIRLDHPNSDQAEIGYELAPQHWGQGFATEAVVAILHFGFETLHLKTIKAHCIATNQRSINLLQKLSFHETERLPQNPDQITFPNQPMPEKCILMLSRETWVKQNT